MDTDVIAENNNNQKGDGLRKDVQPQICDEMCPRRLELSLFSGDNP